MTHSPNTDSLRSEQFVGSKTYLPNGGKDYQNRPLPCFAWSDYNNKKPPPKLPHWIQFNEPEGSNHPVRLPQNTAIASYLSALPPRHQARTEDLRPVSSLTQSSVCFSSRRTSFSRSLLDFSSSSKHCFILLFSCSMEEVWSVGKEVSMDLRYGQEDFPSLLLIL